MISAPPAFLASNNCASAQTPSGRGVQASQTSAGQANGASFSDMLSQATQDSGDNAPANPPKSTKQDTKGNTTENPSSAMLSTSATDTPPLLTLNGILGLLNPQAFGEVESADQKGSGRETESSAKTAAAAKSVSGPGEAKALQKNVANKAHSHGSAANASAEEFADATEMQQSLDPAAQSNAGTANKTDAVTGSGANAPGSNENAASESAAAASNAPQNSIAAGPLAFSLLVSPESTNTAGGNSAAGGAGAASPTADMHAISSLAIATTAQGSASSNLGSGSGGQSNSFATPIAEIAHSSNDRPAAIDQPTTSKAAETEANSDASQTELVRNVHVQMQAENNQRVDVRMTDIGGELRVSVRSSDSNLTQALQDHMPELTNRLEQQHFRTEVWIPRAPETTDSNASHARSFHSQRDSSPQDNPERRQNGRRGNQADWHEEDTLPQAGNKEKTNNVWLQ